MARTNLSNLSGLAMTRLLYVATAVSLLSVLARKSYRPELHKASRLRRRRAVATKANGGRHNVRFTCACWISRSALQHVARGKAAHPGRRVLAALQSHRAVRSLPGRPGRRRANLRAKTISRWSFKQ